MLRFTKMHGIGNDYVYINGFEETVPDPGATAIQISDRHFGVGGDGLIMVLPPEAGVEADVRMRMFNADGSEGEMCGNGIRCVCMFARDRRLSAANPMKIQTGRGVLSVAYTLDRAGRVEQVTVNMGTPILSLGEIPVFESRLTSFNPTTHTARIDAGESWSGTLVSMGNPHLVIFDDANPQLQGKGLATLDLARIGPSLETHAAFPNRINVHWVQVVSKSEVVMRTWERGSGITLACGTGAAAVCVAGALTQRTERSILAHLPGGDLQLRWDASNGSVFKTGSANEVFTGTWSPPATSP